VVVAVDNVWQGGGVSLWRMRWRAMAMGVIVDPPACEVAVDVLFSPWWALTMQGGGHKAW
jgi:hypothetical protein